MSIESISKLIDSISKLVSSLAWPSVMSFLLIKFWPDIRRIFDEREEISVKALGFETTLKNKVSASATALVAARATSPSYTPSPDSAANEKFAAAAVVKGSITPRFLNRARKSVVLWVDDRPDNNTFERQSLEELGVRFILASSTDEALALVSSQRIDAIISDMGRPPDARAGYTLLDELRAKGVRLPYIIYSGSDSPKHVAESRQHGAIGCTNNPYELFEYVVEALRQSA
jgi:CheY-like chemotaxis protein